MRTPTHNLFVAAAFVLAVSPLVAQRNVLRRLTDDDVKTWNAVAIETSVPDVHAEGRWLRLEADGSLTMQEGDREMAGRWSLDEDGGSLIVTDRTAGDWHDNDTLWMDILALSRDSLTLEYRNAFGLLRVSYVAEGASGSSDTAGFAAFYSRFKSAVARRDRKAVTGMTSFPFSSYDLTGFAHKPHHGPEFTRAEFLRYYNKLFTRMARYLIAVSTPTPMSDGEDGIRAMAVGIRKVGQATIWVEFSRDEKGNWWLVRTDNVSME